MPPKAKITREQIVSAAFAIARAEGVDNVTARSISARLNCSTQPVLYSFATVEDIKRAVYEQADAYHSAYILKMGNGCENPLLTIGKNYIRFAIEERNLFRLLFQTDEFAGRGLPELLEAEALLPLLRVLQKELKVSLEEARGIFTTLFIFAHGYASLYANNTMRFAEAEVTAALEAVFRGAAYAAGGDGNEEDV